MIKQMMNRKPFRENKAMKIRNFFLFAAVTAGFDSKFFPVRGRDGLIRPRCGGANHLHRHQLLHGKG